MAKLEASGTDLRVHLTPLEKAGAVHGDVVVPLAAVRDVSIEPSPFARLRGVRAPGTGWPRVIALGTWRHGSGRDFAAVYRGRPAVVVDLHEGEFQRLIVSTRDPERLAQGIRAALYREPAPQA
jgi:hypothetical protein